MIFYLLFYLNIKCFYKLKNFSRSLKCPRPDTLLNYCPLIIWLCLNIKNQGATLFCCLISTLSSGFPSGDTTTSMVGGCWVSLCCQIVNISISLSRLIYTLADLFKINWSVFTIRKFWQNHLILIYFWEQMKFWLKSWHSSIIDVFKINFPSGLSVFQYNWPHQHSSSVANSDSTLCLRCWWDDKVFGI